MSPDKTGKIPSLLRRRFIYRHMLLCLCLIPLSLLLSRPAAGMDDYVSKPINADDLFAAIERLLPAAAQAHA